MYNFFLVIFFSWFAISCNSKTTDKSPTIQSNIAEVYSDDAVMNGAIAEAKATFNTFDTAFKNHHYNKEDFCVKVQFPTATGAEHIWATKIEYKNGAYYGLLDEDAVAVPNIKAGDTVKVTLANLSDWLYSDNGIMRGGYTIKVLRDKMTKEERAHFDSTYYLKIVDQ